MIKDKDLITDAIEAGITYSCFQNDLTRKIFLMAAEHFDKHNGATLSRTALDSMLSGSESPETSAMFRSKYDSITSEFGVQADDYSVLKRKYGGEVRSKTSLCNLSKSFLTELLESTRSQKQLVSKFQNLASSITAFGSEKSFFKVESMAEILDQLMQDTEHRRTNPEEHQGIKCLYPKN